jgi:hypothetical protein
LGDPSKFSTMRAGLAAPIHGPEGFRAVLALYHLERDAFSRTQLKMIEALCARLDQVLWAAASAERQPATTPTADLTRLYAHLEASANSKQRALERAEKIAVS